LTFHVPTRNYLVNATDFANSLHPNSTGHQHIRDAYAGAMQFIPNVAGTATFSLNGSNAVFPGGNVGIGTTVAGSPLTVVGDAGGSGFGTPSILTNDGGGQYTGIEFDNTGTGGHDYSFLVTNSSSGLSPAGSLFLIDVTSHGYVMQVNSSHNTNFIGSLAAPQFIAGGANSAPAWGTAGIEFNAFGPYIFTDTSTVASGTATNAMINSFSTAQLAATNAGVTDTNAATVYIAGPPFSGTNVTITHAYALDVASGTSLFQGPLIGTSIISGVASPSVSGGSVATNAALGNHFRVTPTHSAATTMSAPTNPADGQKITYEIVQDGTGSGTITWNAVFDFGTTGAPTLTTTANKRDVVGFVYSADLVKWLYTGSGLGF
jgi:hypothetical protein